jgi:hypothetical protein
MRERQVGNMATRPVDDSRDLDFRRQAWCLGGIPWSATANHRAAVENQWSW